MKNTHIKRKLFYSLLLMIIALVSLIGSTWAYWNMLTQTKDETITLGYGDTIIVSDSTASSELELIPSTQTPDSTETKEIVFTYTVKINQSAFDGGKVNLTAQVQNILINEDDTYIDLVNPVVVLSAPAFLSASDTITVTVTITLDEPDDLTEYNAVAGKVIKFDVVFTIA